MITNPLSKSLYLNSMNTLIMTVTVIVIYLFLRVFVAKRIPLIKMRQKALARLFYMTAIVYVLFFSRIWIEGFSHIFAVLGIVAAALVITNKESIMNLTGWLVISWRGLFSEEDYIEIEGIKGYVHHIGLLYFTLSSKKLNRKKAATDKLIRVPNGMVSTRPLINYSQCDYPYEQTIELNLKLNQSVETTIDTLQTILNTILTAETDHYLGTHPTKKMEHDTLNLIKKGIQTIKILRQEPPKGVTVTLKFYCFFNTVESIKEQFFSTVISQTLKNKELAESLNMTYTEPAIT